MNGWSSWIFGSFGFLDLWTVEYKNLTCPIANFLPDLARGRALSPMHSTGPHSTACHSPARSPDGRKVHILERVGIVVGRSMATSIQKYFMQNVITASFRRVTLLFSCNSQHVSFQLRCISRCARRNEVLSRNLSISATLNSNKEDEDPTKKENKPTAGNKAELYAARQKEAKAKLNSLLESMSKVNFT